MNGLVIFDLDGTIVDSAATCARVLNTMRVERGYSVMPVEQARPLVSLGADQLLLGMLADALRDPVADLAEFRARYASLPTPPESLYPGVREGLRTLQDCGHRVALCSNKPQMLCEKILAELGLASFFHAIVGGSPARPGKPAPDSLHRAIALAKGRALKCCYVGDSEIDLLTAKHADVPFIFVTYGYGERPLAPLPLLADSFPGAIQLLSLAVGGIKGQGDRQPSSQ